MNFSNLSASLFFSSLVTFSIFLSPTVFAASDSFSVQKVAHPAETSNSSKLDWFQINSASLEGKTTEFKFNLFNPTSQEKTIVVESRSAFAQTNQLLDVTYPYKANTASTQILDPVRLFERYVPASPKEFVVPANSTKQIAMPVNVPNFSGEILGAFAFKEPNKSVEVNTDENKLSTSFLVQNEYVIAVHLISDKPETKPFLFTDAKAVSNGSHFAISFRVENKNPNLQKFPVSYEIKNSNGETVLKNDQKINFKLPPSSRTFYEIPWKDGTIEKGEYTLIINGEELPFSIKEAEIEKAKNDLPVEQAVVLKDGIHWLVYPIIVLSVLFNLYFLIRFLRKKRNT